MLAVVMCFASNRAKRSLGMHPLHLAVQQTESDTCNEIHNQARKQ